MVLFKAYEHTITKMKEHEPYINQAFPKFSSAGEFVALSDSVVNAYWPDVEEVVK